MGSLPRSSQTVQNNQSVLFVGWYECIVTAELALQSQSLSLLLLSNKTDVKRVTPEDLDGDSEEPLGSLELGRECELASSRVEDARHGFAALELLNDTPDERDVCLSSLLLSILNLHSLLCSRVRIMRML